MKGGKSEPPPLKQDVDLSIVVPAFNEENRLPEAITNLKRWLEHQPGTFELILSDDGSTDGTLGVMRAAQRELPYVKVVTRSANRGKGRTLADGIAVSSGDLVLISDADLSTPLDEYSKLQAAVVAGADVAIASRGRRESRIEVPQPPHRVLMGKVFNLLVQLLLLPGIWDTQCGFKLFTGTVARQLFSDLRTDGFAFDVEVLYCARLRGLTIAEVPVRWLHSAPSRVGPIRDSLAMFVELVRIRLRSARSAVAEPAALGGASRP